MKSANEEQKAKISYFRDQSNRFTPDEKICAYTDIYNRLQIKEITQQKMNSLYKLAINELAGLSVDKDSLVEINKINNMLMQRES
jgi:geranylgeranyl diphosphate synthase type II